MSRLTIIRSIATILISIIVAGCATTPQKPVSLYFGIEHFRAKSFTPNETIGKCVGLIFLNNGKKTGFLKTFKKIYVNDQGFADHLSEKLGDEMQDRGVIVSTIIMTTKDSFLDDIRNQYDLKEEIAKIIQQHNLDMAVIVSRWELDSMTVFSVGGMNPTGSGFALNTTVPIVYRRNGLNIQPKRDDGTICVLMIDGLLFDSNGNQLYVGQIGGLSSTGFAFNNALKSAVADAAKIWADMFTGTLSGDRIRLHLPQNANVDQYIELLKSKDELTRVIVIQAIVKGRKFDPKILETMKAELLEEFNMDFDDYHENKQMVYYHVDALSWFCNALGASGVSKYQSTLEKVSIEAKNNKIKRYAKKNLERLRSSHEN